MPTLGEFIARAKLYGYTKQTIRIPELRAKLVYLRRGLCATTGIPLEDFGL